MERKQDYVLRTVEERGVRLVRLWFTDVLGQLKSVAISPAELEAAFSEGVQFDGTAIDGFSRVHESDVLARPDATTFELLPWAQPEEPSARSRGVAQAAPRQRLTARPYHETRHSMHASVGLRGALSLLRILLSTQCPSSTQPPNPLGLTIRPSGLSNRSRTDGRGRCPLPPPQARPGGICPLCR